MYKTPMVSVLELAKLIGLLSSTVQAVFPARFQFYSKCRFRLYNTVTLISKIWSKFWMRISKVLDQM